MPTLLEKILVREYQQTPTKEEFDRTTEIARMVEDKLRELHPQTYIAPLRVSEALWHGNANELFEAVTSARNSKSLQFGSHTIYSGADIVNSVHGVAIYLPSLGTAISYMRPSIFEKLSKSTPQSRLNGKHSLAYNVLTEELAHALLINYNIAREVSLSWESLELLAAIDKSLLANNSATPGTDIKRYINIIFEGQRGKKLDPAYIYGHVLGYIGFAKILEITKEGGDNELLLKLYDSSSDAELLNIIRNECEPYYSIVLVEFRNRHPKLHRKLVEYIDRIKPKSYRR